MNAITPRPALWPSHSEPTDPTYTTFCGVRTLLASALASWLNTHPEDDVVDLEINGTCSLVRQLVALARGTAS